MYMYMYIVLEEGRSGMIFTDLLSMVVYSVTMCP